MTMDKQFDISIIGIVGIPASYGGFETLAEQLTQHISSQYRIQVFCTARRYPDKTNRPQECYGARLRYLNWDANGWQSIPYDILSLWLSARESNVLLILGVSGCLMLPIVRLLWPETRIVTNVDGVEWKRHKWGIAARAVLRLSEWFAVRFSHAIVSDNQGIREYISRQYGTESYLIAYGGDQTTETADAVEPLSKDTRFDPGSYQLAVCRIEPENHVAEILEVFERQPEHSLVFIGNWEVSDYAQSLRKRFGDIPNIELKNPIYNANRLNRLRESARAYIHGHSAGGTNPSLVETMHCGTPVMAFDINYNRHTTQGKAIYWGNAKTLSECLNTTSDNKLIDVACKMREIAQSHYTWTMISSQYLQALFPDP